MKTATIDDAVNAGACYTRTQLKEVFGDKETLTVQDIAALPIPSKDKMWALTRPHFLDTKEKAVKFAVFCAEQCLSIYENNYPDDSRPRKAIEAAKNWVTNPTEENANAAAWAAADAAARAAADAADAAWAAARAAAWAADAAANAANAADAANAANAADAANAANAADAANAANAAWAADAARAAAWAAADAADAAANAAAWAAADAAAWAAAANAARAAQVEFLVKLLTEET